jgi:AbrB family looped-hinge helix DNA binding protein
MTERISAKGQLMIPQRLRKALNLRTGDFVTLWIEGEKLLVQRHQPNRARLKKGKFGRPVLVARSGAPPMTPDRVKNLMQETP